ncbi:hypothetical protein BC781_10448 [Sediminitomix flava]|uniref:Uncharacterized protein n=1 Tax=Sediminitomix flava TaxID=379075 RepID=A0A315Z8M2_SEDFL|nr:hypothetical protein BC781_10448 [Sediminitomix flava]
MKSNTYKPRFKPFYFTFCLFILLFSVTVSVRVVRVFFSELKELDTTIILGSSLILFVLLALSLISFHFIINSIKTIKFSDQGIYYRDFLKNKSEKIKWKYIKGYSTGEVSGNISYEFLIIQMHNSSLEIELNSLNYWKFSEIEPYLKSKTKFLGTVSCKQNILGQNIYTYHTKNQFKNTKSKHKILRAK